MEKNGNSLRDKVFKSIGFAMWMALIIVAFIYRDEVTVGSLLHYTPHNVAAAILVMLALFALKSLSIVFYSGVLFTVNGVLFELPLALAVNLGGIIIMLSLPYLIGKQQGSITLEHLYEEHPKLTGVAEIYVGNDFVFTILMRMMRIISYDICSMYLGARKLRYVPYAVGSMLAIIPSMLVYTLVGSQLDDINLTIVITVIILEITSTIISFTILRKRNINRDNGND